MKKLGLLIAISVASLGAIAQSNWTWGLTAGSFHNKSQFSSGMSDANARFHRQPFESGMFGVVFRKKINNHLSFQTGFNFRNIGFQYAIAENYSLLSKKDRNTVNKMEIGTANIPASLIYNTNFNCRNVRWFVGGGLSLVMSGQNINSTKNITPEGESAANNGATTVTYLSQTVNSSSYTTLNGHIMGGVEKQFKSGRMLSLGLIINRGFSPVATSTVNYNIDGKEYNHTFTNFGSYGGLTLTYYFKAKEVFKKKASK